MRYVIAGGKPISKWADTKKSDTNIVGYQKVGLGSDSLKFQICTSKIFDFLFNKYNTKNLRLWNQASSFYLS